jgi:tight adherence protein B
MSDQGIGLLPLISGASAFALVLALWGMLLIFKAMRAAAQEEVLRARLGELGEAPAGTRTLRLWHEGAEQTVRVAGGRGRLGLWARMEERRLAAGIAAPLERLLLLVAVFSVVTGALMFGITGRLVPASFGASFVLLAAWMYISGRVLKRVSLFNRQLVDTLDLSARALRAGHPLIGSFQLVAEEVPAPVGTIFAEICQQQEMGLGLEEALRRAAAMTQSGDMRLFSATLAINLRIGGNLADVMQGLAKVIRERMRLSRRFQTLFAQTQFSKRLLMAMPFAALLGLHVVSPGYVDVLYATTVGNVLLMAAGVSLFLGWMVMNMMAKVKV